MSYAPIDRVLGSLDKIQKRQDGQWSARCPSHQDNGPSLSIRENPDGAVLIHCFGGCTVTDVVAAMGMELADLFPPQEKSGREPQRRPRPLSASQALELLDSESQLVVTAAVNVAHGVTLTPADRQRLLKAAARVSWLFEQSGGPHA